MNRKEWISLSLAFFIKRIKLYLLYFSFVIIRSKGKHGEAEMATINDVAKRAGVTKSTVSKVLNQYEMVSKETKEKVLKAVNELHYVPNNIAVSLSKKGFDRVGLVVNINNQRQAIDEINMQYLFGAFTKLKQYNLDSVTMFSSQFEEMTSEEMIRYLRSQGITCLVIYGLSKGSTNLHKIIDTQLFRCVVVDAPNVNDKTSSVSVNHVAGQYEVAKRTIQPLGKPLVLYLAGEEQGYVTELRLHAMYRLQSELGFPMIVKHADFSERKARELTFSFGEQVDVIVCASDLMAIGAKKALEEMGLHRKLCGYDGITLMGYTGQNILTVRQDFYRVSAVAIDELHQLIQGEAGRSTMIDYEIVQMRYIDVIF